MGWVPRLACRLPAGESEGWANLRGVKPLRWPTTRDELVLQQVELGTLWPPLWTPQPGWVAGACFACSPRGSQGPGQPQDPLWAAAVLWTPDQSEVALACGLAPAAYEPGLLALREGPILEAAVRALPRLPDVLLVNATGRDHPRRAGLALHLGAMLDIPTVGVTDRPLVARGEHPADVRGARTPLLLEGEVVGFCIRTRARTRPVCAHSAWRTDPQTAAEVVTALARRYRTPEPLRLARKAAREARIRDVACSPG